MIYAEKGKEQECFIDFVEKALGILAQEKYHDFQLCLTKQNQEIDVFTLRDGSGYCMDYDLTLQIEFLKKGDGYIVSLDDLHTL